MSDQEPQVELKEPVSEKIIACCLKCNHKLKEFSVGGSLDFASIFSGAMGTAIPYCNNRECERYGLLSLAYVKILESEYKFKDEDTK